MYVIENYSILGYFFKKIDIKNCREIVSLILNE